MAAVEVTITAAQQDSVKGAVNGRLSTIVAGFMGKTSGTIEITYTPGYVRYTHVPDGDVIQVEIATRKVTLTPAGGSARVLSTDLYLPLFTWAAFCANTGA